MSDYDAIAEINMHKCTICNETFHSGNPNKLIGAFGFTHIVCPRCLLCEDCGDEFDSMDEVVCTSHGNYCIACAADKIDELMGEK